MEPSQFSKDVAIRDNNYKIPLKKPDFGIIFAVVSDIFALLDVLSLCHCAQVCNSWKKLSEDNKIWNPLACSLGLKRYLKEESNKLVKFQVIQLIQEGKLAEIVKTVSEFKNKLLEIYRNVDEQQITVIDYCSATNLKAHIYITIADEKKLEEQKVSFCDQGKAFSLKADKKYFITGMNEADFQEERIRPEERTITIGTLAIEIIFHNINQEIRSNPWLRMDTFSAYFLNSRKNSSLEAQDIEQSSHSFWESIPMWERISLTQSAFVIFPGPYNIK